MARPSKQGLDYFPLDVHFDDDIELIEAEHGLEGLAILIKLWQKIYKNGYYILWDDDVELLFSRKINTEKTRVSSVINSCLRRNLFSERIYKKYGILTGTGVQKRYLSACLSSKRKYISFFEEYCLLEGSQRNQISELIKINTEEIDIKSEETPNKTVFTNEINPQSKVKEKKINNICLINEFFEKVWSIYKRKEGKGKISDSKKKQLFELGDELFRAVERYNQKLERDKTDLKYIQMGSTFFNSGYIDYLDKEYGQVTVTAQPKSPVQIEIIEKEF